MARQDEHTEYIVTQDAFTTAYTSLPEKGIENQKAQSVKIMARQYRQNVSETINAGKWTMWAIAEESFEFTWLHGGWQPPVNLVILRP